MMRERDNKGRFIASMHCQYDDERKIERNNSNYGDSITTGTIARWWKDRYPRLYGAPEWQIDGRPEFYQSCT